MNCKRQTSTTHKPKPTTQCAPPPPPLQVSHIGTWRDGSFGGDALDDNMIVEGWDRCVRRVAWLLRCCFDR